MSELTVCLTFDLDAESAQIRQKENPVRISKGQFAIQRGMPRILSLLNKYEINATFFVCGWVAETYPETVSNILIKEHEVAAHGYMHEYLDKLSYDVEQTIHERTNTILENLGGKVQGFRAPYWILSNYTLEIISDLGYIYDSSLMNEDRPHTYTIPETDKRIVEFPVEWYLDDWILFEEKQQTPSAVFEIWKSQFDAMMEMEDREENRCVYTLTCHPSCIGHSYRIQVLERLIKYMNSHKAQFSKMKKIATDFFL